MSISTKNKNNNILNHVWLFPVMAKWLMFIYLLNSNKLHLAVVMCWLQVNLCQAIHAWIVLPSQFGGVDIWFHRTE